MSSPGEHILGYRSTKYMRPVDPNTGESVLPTAKQLAFLSDRANSMREILFGGAAGGGKSVALLMAALQYVECTPDDSPEMKASVGGYSALILRRTYADLSLPGALMDMAAEWLAPTDAVWNSTEKTWRFPSGASLTFGYLERPNDKFRYQGSAFSYVAFDEASQFTEDQYTYLFSRIRKNANDPIPLRMRCGSNPGGSGHCVPYGEVLTPDGFIDIRDISVGDRVFTVLDNGKMVESFVEQVHANHYDGDIVNVSARGLSMTVTPNHSVGQVVGDRIKLVQYDDLPGQATIARAVTWSAEFGCERFFVDEYKTRKRRVFQPNNISMEDYMELLGWFLSEGHIVDRDKAFGISQMKQPQRMKISQLLDRCGFSYSTNTSGFVVYAADWWNHFRQFGKCRDKFIPKSIKSDNIFRLRILFDALIDGDGHWTGDRGGSGQYYTTSRVLADDVCEVALKLGYIVHLSSRQRENRVGLSYCVSFKKTKSFGTEILTGHHKYNVETTTKRISDITRKYYSGMVAFGLVVIPGSKKGS